MAKSVSKFDKLIHFHPKIHSSVSAELISPYIPLINRAFTLKYFRIEKKKLNLVSILTHRANFFANRTNYGISLRLIVLE